MSQQHTPTPWAVNEEHPTVVTVARGNIVNENQADDVRICITAGHPCDDDSYDAVLGNAEFIVRACNAHDALLAACQNAYTQLALIQLASWAGNIKRGSIDSRESLGLLAKAIAVAEDGNAS